ncbi:MAG: hypothetical protein IJT50_00320 [Lentisphaeria bacterium]|nr:hypothetical protein [Lentisphaeria bacterium]
MANLDKEKIQAFRDAIDGEKLAQVIQDMPEERIAKAFKNKDIQKLADKLGEDLELFEAVMGVYDTEKSYAAAVAAVPGNYTKAEFDEFRTVYANLFLKDLHGEVFEGGADSKKLSDEELEQVAGGVSFGSVFSFVGKGLNCVVDKLPMSDDAKKRTKLIVSTVSAVGNIAIGTVMCATGAGAAAGGLTIASGVTDLANAIHGAATLNKK